MSKTIIQQIKQLEESFCNPRKIKEAQELRDELKKQGFTDKEINEQTE